eukprot:scaffold29.g5917.t1
MPAMLGQHNLAIFLSAFVVAGSLTKLCLLHHRLLLGLRAYFVAGSTPAGVRGKHVKTRQSKKSIEPELGGAESLVLAPVTPRLTVDTPYVDALDTLIVLSLTAMLGLAIGEGATAVLGWHASVAPPALAAALALVALGRLAQVDLLSGSTSRDDKIYACFFGFLGLAAALAVQLLGRTSLVAWDLEAAAGAVVPLLVELARLETLAGVEPPPGLALPTRALQVTLSLAAAAIATLLFAPCLRFARATWLQLHPPDWSADCIPSGALAKALVTLQLVLPLAAALMWVRPLGQELWHLSPRQLGTVQAGLLLAAATVAALNARRLLQRFLDTALISWYQAKHGGLASKRTDRAAAGNLVRAKCRVVLLLLGKTAVQGLAPAALFLALGLLRLFSLAHPTLVAGGNALLDGVVGFLAFWTGACWFALCALFLWLFRTGTLHA